MSENPHNWHPCFASGITEGQTYALHQDGSHVFLVIPGGVERIEPLFGTTRHVLVTANNEFGKIGKQVFHPRDVVYLHTPDGIAPSIPRQAAS